MLENQHYQLDAPDAAALKKMVAAVPDLRRKAIESYLANHGLDATLNLFAQSLGMANSVAQNCREMAEMFVLEHSDLHPYTADQINLPTMTGACMGAAIAARCQPTPRGACEGCAYRLGSIANQCEPTVDDTTYTLDNLKDFMCHAEFDAKGEPVKVCAGHAKASSIK